MGTLVQKMGSLHGRVVAPRRARRLSDHVLDALPRGCRTMIDVGCGTGAIGALVLARRPGLSVTGLDVRRRPGAPLPVRLFDGRTLPFDDRSQDCVAMIDVLHHTDDPAVLLAEAARVARRAIVIKDHLLAGVLADPTLRVMDWVGNRPHGVALKYNYWRHERWLRAFDALDLTVDLWRDRLDLYPWPFTLAFDRRLHFVARLVPRDRTEDAP